MNTSLYSRIIEYLEKHQKARVNDLWRHFAPISRVAVHKNLKKLVSEKVVEKIGKPPLVFYSLKKTVNKPISWSVPSEVERVLDKNYVYVSPRGNIETGSKGFMEWCISTNQETKASQLAEIYVQTLQKYNKSRTPQGWIDATFKITSTFPDASIDKLFYADFYSLQQFGKTRLGNFVLYAKQSQNRKLIKDICKEIKPLLCKIIKSFKIEAVTYIPPSVPRNIQFMHELEAYLNLPLPSFKLLKVASGQIIVAQKTLEKLSERVENANRTIFVKEKTVPYRRILLIDDAVGSGASMNEVAKKIKSQFRESDGKNQPVIIGFAVVGSYKGFEVIREV